jgi:hypothetical protein
MIHRDRPFEVAFADHVGRVIVIVHKYTRMHIVSSYLINAYRPFIICRISICRAHVITTRLRDSILDHATDIRFDRDDR